MLAGGSSRTSTSYWWISRKCKLFEIPVTHITCRKVSSKHVTHPEYCMQSVRKNDHENFLSTLLLPQEARRGAFAIRAFNVEVAQASGVGAGHEVKDSQLERTIGLMKIQFWKDSIDKIFEGHPPETPVAMELAKVVGKTTLSKHWFTRLLEARENDMTDKAFQNLHDVEHYSERTFSSLLFLILELVSVRDVQADHAASHIGKAQGLITLIRATCFHASRDKIFLPTDLMIKYGVSQEEVRRGCQEQKMKDLVFDLGSEAHHHLELARSFKKEVPKSAIPVFLPTVTCEAYLKGLQRADFNVFDNRLQQRNHWLPLLLWSQKLRGTY